MESHTADGEKPYDKNNRRTRGKYITTTSRQPVRPRNRGESWGRGSSKVTSSEMLAVPGTWELLCQKCPKSKVGGGGFAFITGLSCGGWVGRRMLLTLLGGRKHWGRGGDCPFPGTDLVEEGGEERRNSGSPTCLVSWCPGDGGAGSVRAQWAPCKHCNKWNTGGHILPLLFSIDRTTYTEKDRRFWGELYGIRD